MRNLMLSNALGNMQSYQEHLKTTVYIKIGGQTERIIGDSKIENRANLPLLLHKRKKENIKEAARWKYHKLSKVKVAQT